MNFNQKQLMPPKIAGYLPAPKIETWKLPELDLDDAPFPSTSPMPPKPELSFEPGHSSSAGDEEPMFTILEGESPLWKLYSLERYEHGKFVHSFSKYSFASPRVTDFMNSHSV